MDNDGPAGNTIAKIDFTRLFDLIGYQNIKYNNRNALNHYTNGKWRSFSTSQIATLVDSLSRWFLEVGFLKGDKLAIVPKMGNPFWVMIDFACQQIGVIVVPLLPNAAEDWIKLILEETESRMCITADAGLYYKIQAITKSLNWQVEIFHLESGISGFFNTLQKDSTKPTDPNDLIAIKDSISTNDIATIIYTSGTSGEPKGVVLSHANIVSNIKAIMSLIPLQPKHRALSFLPFSHIFERTTCFAYMGFGIAVYFSNNRESISRDFLTVKPHCCTSVPRILEKMYDFLLEQGMEKNRFKKLIINWAMKVGQKYKDHHESDFLYNLQLFFARLFVLDHWGNKLGGKIKFMAVGAAALRPQIARLFSAAKITTMEGYGMTEASPYIAINRYGPALNKIGTVGLPIPGLELRIDCPPGENEGEIQIKGPNVMLGYFKKPAVTADSFTHDGWFKTGDVGKLVEGRYLKLTDRKKDIFKTTSGKYISPQKLQNLFACSGFIQQCLIIGFNKPFVSALIVPHFSILKTWCETQEIHWTSAQYMVHNIKVIAVIQNEIDLINENLENYERIKKFVLCDQEWTYDNGGLTHSFKPVRKILLEKYHKQIQAVYSPR